jgi:hypothetical protein
MKERILQSPVTYADLYDTTPIFGFDAVFAKNGYELPGPASSVASHGKVKS